MLNLAEIKIQLEKSKQRREDLLTQVEELPTEKLSSYEALWMGNDPINQEAFVAHQTDKPFLLVGTSMFGTIVLATYLAKNKHFIPEIIIVDDSSKVTKCWEIAQNYFASSQETDGVQFVNNFITHLKNNDVYTLSMDFCYEAEAENLQKYLLKLIDTHGLEYIKALVNGSLILKQSWGHLDTFTKIREVYKDSTIYAYPSNIIHCIRDLNSQIEVATCIEALQPKLSIQTNLKDGEPKDCYLISTNSVDVIMNTLGRGPFINEEDVVDSTSVDNIQSETDSNKINRNIFFSVKDSEGVQPQPKTGLVTEYKL